MKDVWNDLENNRIFSTNNSKELLMYLLEHSIKDITNIHYRGTYEVDTNEDYLTEHWQFKEKGVEK